MTDVQSRPEAGSYEALAESAVGWLFGLLVRCPHLRGGVNFERAAEWLVSEGATSDDAAIALAVEARRDERTEFAGVLTVLREVESELTCKGCGGHGQVEHEEYVTREMALDACEPSMEGMPQLVTVQCPGCSGSGYVSALGPRIAELVHNVPLTGRPGG